MNTTPGHQLWWKSVYNFDHRLLNWWKSFSHAPLSCWPFKDHFGKWQFHHNSLSNWDIWNFELKLKFEKTKIKILSKSLKFSTGTKAKLLIDEMNEIKQNWMINFIYYCLVTLNCDIFKTTSCHVHTYMYTQVYIYDWETLKASLRSKAMNRHKWTEQNLGQVFNSRYGRACVCHAITLLVANVIKLFLLQ